MNLKEFVETVLKQLERFDVDGVGFDLVVDQNALVGYGENHIRFSVEARVDMVENVPHVSIPHQHDNVIIQ